MSKYEEFSLYSYFCPHGLDETQWMWVAGVDWPRIIGWTELCDSIQYCCPRITKCWYRGSSPIQKEFLQGTLSDLQGDTINPVADGGIHVPSYRTLGETGVKHTSVLYFFAVCQTLGYFGKFSFKLSPIFLICKTRSEEIRPMVSWRWW